MQIYRYYSKSRIDHYYTSDYTELARGDDVYSYQGVGFYLAASQDELENSIPIYQFYHADPSYDHYYTTKPSQFGHNQAFVLGYCYPV